MDFEDLGPGTCDVLIYPARFGEVTCAIAIEVLAPREGRNGGAWRSETSLYPWGVVAIRAMPFHPEIVSGCRLEIEEPRTTTDMLIFWYPLS